MLVCISTVIFNELFKLQNILPSVHCQFKGSLMRIDHPNLYSLGINGVLKVKSMQDQELRQSEPKTNHQNQNRKLIRITNSQYTLKDIKNAKK